MLNTITSRLKHLFLRKATVDREDKPKAPKLSFPVQQQALKENYPFIHYLKGRLIDAIDEETGERWTGHVAMFYRDSGRIKIDWDNGATTYHQIGEDAVWLFKLVSTSDTKKDS